MKQTSNKKSTLKSSLNITKKTAIAKKTKSIKAMSPKNKTINIDTNNESPKNANKKKTQTKQLTSNQPTIPRKASNYPSEFNDMKPYYLSKSEYMKMKKIVAFMSNKNRWSDDW